MESWLLLFIARNHTRNISEAKGLLVSSLVDQYCLKAFQLSGSDVSKRKLIAEDGSFAWLSIILNTILL